MILSKKLIDKRYIRVEQISNSRYQIWHLPTNGDKSKGIKIADIPKEDYYENNLSTQK